MGWKFWIRQFIEEIFEQDEDEDEFEQDEDDEDAEFNQMAHLWNEHLIDEFNQWMAFNENDPVYLIEDDPVY